MSTHQKDEYQTFCQKEKSIPIFSKPWYLDAVCGKEGWDVLMVKKGNEIAVTMPIEVRKKYGLQLPRLPLFVKYWGPYFTKNFKSEKQQQKLMRELISLFPKFDLFEQYFHPSVTNCLPFHWENFEIIPRDTFIIEPLNDLEKTFANISTDYRNNKIPKAKSLVNITTDRTLEEFYNLQLKTFSRNKFPIPFSFDFLKKYDKALKENNARQIFFAVDEKSQIHSAVYIIWDEETVYFLMAGDDPDLRNSGAGILLTWHAIEYAKEVLRKNRFDFLGSMIEPITRVRRNFGATQVPYFHIKKFNSKLVRLLFELKG